MTDKVAAEVIVDAALPRLAQQAAYCVTAAQLAGAETVLSQEAEHRRHPEFWCDLQATYIGSNRLSIAFATWLSGDGSGAAPGCSAGSAASRSRSGVVLLRIVSRSSRKASAVPLQHLTEGRLAPTRLQRETGAAPERVAARREKHDQRPTALLAHHLKRRHTKLDDIRPLPRSTLMLTYSAFTSAAVPASPKDSCAIAWHQWQAA